jgi:tripartite-type tricarboxylate transporter receptor subunit TctC
MSSNFLQGRRLFAATAIAFAASTCGIAQAQGPIAKPAGFPDKPVRLIVPFNAGSPPDIIARTIQIPLQNRIGQPVLVENRPGANGNIGTTYVMNQPADGYSYVVCGLTCATGDVFYKNPGYNMRKDMSPVINFGVFPSVLIVSEKSPIKSAAELLDYLKKHPGTQYASWGRGGSPHIAAEQLRSIGHLDVQHVPFGSTDPMIDVAAGRITFMFAPAGAVIAKKDILRPLAVASAEREPLLPGLPTMEEQGLKGFRMEAWNGLYTGGKVPADRVEYMNQQINAVLREPEVKARFDAAGMRIVGGSRKELADWFDQDNKRWHDMAKATGLQPE